ncbi:hypothetical protein LTR94_033198, partial [Friedmanniomyces endolithicus]
MVEPGEAMLLDRQHFLGQEGLGPFLRERAEGAVTVVAPRAAGDLRHLRDGQAAAATPVEFVQPGKGDMRDIHVEPHADRIGGDEIVDLARLEHLDLCVAGARGKRPHHHRGASAQTAQHFGDGVNLLGREGDDRRALGQPADLLGARI